MVLGDFRGFYFAWWCLMVFVLGFDVGFGCVGFGCGLRFSVGWCDIVPGVLGLVLVFFRFALGG